MLTQQQLNTQEAVMGSHYGNVMVEDDISSNNDRNSTSPNPRGVLNDRNVEGGFYSQTTTTANELAPSSQPTVQQQ